MTTDDDTVCIVAPDYTENFMKRYLVSCIFGYEKETNTSHFHEYTKDWLKCKNDSPNKMLENKNYSPNKMLEYNEDNTEKDKSGYQNVPDGDLIIVDLIVKEFVEKLVEVCVNDDEKHKYKEDDRKDDYNLRYYFDHQTRKDMPFRLAEYVVRMQGHSRKVRKVLETYKSILIENFHVTEETRCNICLKEFSRPAHCKAHIENIHSGEKIYQCEKCQNKFKTKNGLRTHLQRSHENESKDPFICSVCGTVFLLRSSLVRHCKAEQHISYPKTDSATRKNRLSESSETKCKICHKIIASHALESHMKRDHTEEARVFKCDMCKFETKRHDSLLRHYREKHQRFQRDFDAIKTTFKDGDSSYQCPDCKKIIRTKDEVEDHLVGKICSLTCNICNKTFSRKNYLKLHKKKVHGETSS